MYYITKVERKFIFEVIDSESINEMISDYIQAVFAHAHAIIFITKPEREAEVNDAVTTINDILREDLKIKKRPYYGLLTIDPKEYKEAKAVKKELNKYLEKYWYTPHPIEP